MKNDSPQIGLPPQRHGSGQPPMCSSTGHAHALTTDLAPADLAPTRAQHVALGSEMQSEFVRTTYNTPLWYRTLGLHMTWMRPPDVCNKSFICVIDRTVFLSEHASDYSHDLHFGLEALPRVGCRR